MFHDSRLHGGLFSIPPFVRRLVCLYLSRASLFFSLNGSISVSSGGREHDKKRTEEEDEPY
jgi:hypothetical protein